METTTQIAPKKKKKKRSGIVGYFVPFGLRQATDLLMIVGAIMIFVGLFVHGFLGEPIPVIIGLSMYVLAGVLAVIRCLRVLLNKELSRKSAEFKNAIINLCIMVVILALASVGIAAAVLGW